MTAFALSTQRYGLPPLRLLHFGYVTRDMEHGIERLQQIYGKAQSVKRNLGVRVSTPAGIAHIDYAALKIGEQSFESIQPGQGAEPVYEMNLPESPEMIGFHHLGSRVASPAEWNDLMSTVTQNDLPLLVHGKTGTVDYAYVDLRQSIGHIIEYLHYG